MPILQRKDDADRPDDPGSHAVFWSPNTCSTRTGSFARAVLAAFRASALIAIAIGPALNAALETAPGELCLDLIAAIAALGLRSPYLRNRLRSDCSAAKLRLAEPLSLRPHVCRAARIENIFEFLAVARCSPLIGAVLSLGRKYSHGTIAVIAASGSPWRRSFRLF